MSTRIRTAPARLCGRGRAQCGAPRHARGVTHRRGIRRDAERHAHPRLRTRPNTLDRAKAGKIPPYTRFADDAMPSNVEGFEYGVHTHPDFRKPYQE